MRRMYVFFALSILIVMALLTFAFLFFEKEKHKSLFYTISMNGTVAGHVKADRYRTEDKIVYKSTTSIPEEARSFLVREKIFFEKKRFLLKSFAREYKHRNLKAETLYIATDGRSFDFLARQDSKWNNVVAVPHAKDIIVFDETSIAAYMPFIDKYNFSKGGAQSFNILYITSALLPPARGRAVFKSIRDEYIKVEGKKTKTEVLVVRAKTLPQIHIWVSKKDRHIVQLEIKKTGLFMRQTAFSPKIKVARYTPKGAMYSLADTLFPSGDIALAGTVTLPDKEGPLPAILMVTGEGPYTRENGGLYTDICDRLTRKGFVTLRYDRRGTGASQGEISSVNLDDEIRDIESALKFLSSQKQVDKTKLFIMFHGEASAYAPQLDFPRLPVSGLVILSMIKPGILPDFTSNHLSDKIKELVKLDSEYSKTLESLQEQTLTRIKNTTKTHISIQGKRLFTGKMRGLLEFNPLDGFKRLSTPSLIIYGKKDKFGSLQYVNDVENALSEAESTESQVVYFRRLGHFLGAPVNESHTILHYAIDAEVMETIIGWLDKRCAADLTNP